MDTAQDYKQTPHIFSYFFSFLLHFSSLFHIFSYFFTFFFRFSTFSMFSMHISPCIFFHISIIFHISPYFSHLLLPTLRPAFCVLFFGGRPGVSLVGCCPPVHLRAWTVMSAAIRASHSTVFVRRTTQRASVQWSGAVCTATTEDSTSDWADSCTAAHLQIDAARFVGGGSGQQARSTTTTASALVDRRPS